jgi:predicted RNase H-like HicB family nuclease
MAREFNVVVERDSEGTYVASVSSIPGCQTQARSIDELIPRIQEAIALHLEEQGEEGIEPLEFIGVEHVTVPA